MQITESRPTPAARLRARLSYANVAATIAAFGVLTTGGAYAASKIGPKDIRKNAVRAKHIKKKSVKGKHIKPGHVRTKQLGDVSRLGTLAENPLKLIVAGSPALRLEPAEDSFGAPAPNVVGGSPTNEVANGVLRATISGGSSNAARGNRATVGGGSGNKASADSATVGGGIGNTASGPHANVDGGIGNTAGSSDATVGGGGNNTASGSDSTVGGGDSNSAGERATVSGGSSNAAGGRNSAVGGGAANTASGFNATVGGGAINTASGFRSTIAGGSSNETRGVRSTIAGGSSNEASGLGSSVGGGQSNTAGGSRATVSGGLSNAASGFRATVPGGERNIAAGAYSFATGRRAEAISDGTFVWADSINARFAFDIEDFFAVRATGGVRFVTGVDSSNPAFHTSGVRLAAGGSSWRSISDRASKEEIERVDGREVLSKLAEFPVSTWSWKSQPGVRHMGPMAQDFADAFGLGSDRKTIATVDADGVALAAIQGLHAENRKLRRRNRAQDRRHRELEQRISELERRAER